MHRIWCAVWNTDTTLAYLVEVPGVLPLTTLPKGTHLAIEKPQIYGKAKSSGLIDLAIRVGWVEGTHPWETVREYEPRQWKGQLKKPVDHGRTWAVLSEDERKVVDLFSRTKVMRENIMDAVGIGLKWQKRRNDGTG